MIIDRIGLNKSTNGALRNMLLSTFHGYKMKHLEIINLKFSSPPHSFITVKKKTNKTLSIHSNSEAGLNETGTKLPEFLFSQLSLWCCAPPNEGCCIFAADCWAFQSR
ncbi:hypothetical protein CEXT_712911 [Caerostris extrusa]|uniref:Uncharacterized protein n=1 Tax=Caerostris extrusa TaxID=172846 RepID=A0AAV4N642_CAEEX|nr:hypothetical protein CEXT_712911 [Caerostris extrusa]